MSGVCRVDRYRSGVPPRHTRHREPGSHAMILMLARVCGGAGRVTAGTVSTSSWLQTPSSAARKRHPSARDSGCRARRPSSGARRQWSEGPRALAPSSVAPGQELGGSPRSQALDRRTNDLLRGATPPASCHRWSRGLLPTGPRWCDDLAAVGDRQLLQQLLAVPSGISSK
jgi:hypothetical protein